MVSFVRAFAARRKAGVASMLLTCAALLAVAGSASAAPPPGPKPSQDKWSIPAGLAPRVPGQVMAYSDERTVSAGGIGGATARCPAGTYVMGGGGSNDSYIGEVLLTDSRPQDYTSWTVYVRSISTYYNNRFRAWAMCAP